MMLDKEAEEERVGYDPAKLKLIQRV